MSRAPDVLERIAERRRERLAELADAQEAASGLVPAPVLDSGRNAFLAALKRRRGRAVIAEIKLGSPRLGSLVGKVGPLAQARTYARHGAAALSVVVEPDFFHGSYDLLARCSDASGLPALAKDFVLHPVQLLWAREAGAEAVLLIASLLTSEELHRLAGLARGLELVPLVETHDAADVAKLGGEAWELVGVNNRDLRTFEVDLERSAELLPSLPAAALKVAESGISGGEDVRRLARAGFDAFLVGEALLLADDPGALLAELAG
ncbi:MAG TPA: indole-3-glycerol-phosphate synthase [Thermoanaerobaculia bacterium]|nr:indole-3-glycerol-phosphate synthase [Thermoanaerobaculia bacterium]